MLNTFISRNLVISLFICELQAVNTGDRNWTPMGHFCVLRLPFTRTFFQLFNCSVITANYFPHVNSLNSIKKPSPQRPKHHLSSRPDLYPLN